MLTNAEIEAIHYEMSQTPHKKAAVIEALKVVLKHRGWVSDECIESIATLLDMSPTEVDSVASFYNLIYRRPVGRHIIHLCDSISCYVMGYETLYQALQQQLGIRFGETNNEQGFTLLPNCCLGCCDHAPALMIDEDLYKDVTPDHLQGILKSYT